MKADLFFHTLNEIDDKYVEEVTECIGKENKKTVHRYRRILGTAAILALICILSSAFPSMARKIPFIGNVFEYLQTQLDFPGPFDKIATSAEMTVRNSGITVTIQELYCDGENLFVSYLIESDKVFSEYTSERYLETQLDFSGENYIQADGEILETDPFGAAGLEGRFVDEHTFAGADVIRLVDRQFPDEFIFTLEVHSWNLLVNRGEKEIWGSWKLSVPVRVNHENVEILEVNRTENRHSIDKVTVSPIAITVYTSYPEIYTGTVNYNVIVFSDKSDERIDFQGRYGAVEGKTWIPRDMAGDVLDIYVVDMSTFTLTGIEAFEKSEIEKHAIVSAHVELPQSVEDNLH